MKFLLALLFSLNSFAGLPPTAIKGSGDSGNVTNFNFQFPNYQITHTGITGAIGPFIPRVNTTASTSSLTIDCGTTDLYTVTALAASLTINAPSCSIAPTAGQALLIRIKDNGTARTLAWNVIYVAVGISLPTTTVLGKYLYIACIWNEQASEWDVVGVSEQ